MLSSIFISLFLCNIGSAEEAVNITCQTDKFFNFIGIEAGIVKSPENVVASASLGSNAKCTFKFSIDKCVFNTVDKLNQYTKIFNDKNVSQELININETLFAWSTTNISYNVSGENIDKIYSYNQIIGLSPELKTEKDRRALHGIFEYFSYLCDLDSITEDELTEKLAGGSLLSYEYFIVKNTR
jgi:hypothetical protein